MIDRKAAVTIVAGRVFRGLRDEAEANGLGLDSITEASVRQRIGDVCSEGDAAEYAATIITGRAWARFEGDVTRKVMRFVGAWS